MENSHRRNDISRLKINGVWITKKEELRQGIVNAYKTLLYDLGEWRASPKGLDFSRLTELEANRMKVPFSEEEVYAALKDLNGDKTPGPDSFTIAFWQSTWPMVKEDTMKVFKDFFETGKFVRSINTTFLVMVPKKGGPEVIKDCMPISLVGNLYKLIAKALANRLKRVVSKLVNKAQHAFVEGRQILDAPLIANEVVDSLLRRKGLSAC